MFIFVTDKCIFKTTNSAMSRQTPFIACICITAIAVCIALPSCRKADSSAERVKQWIGREIVIPDSLHFSVLGENVDRTMTNADFTVITYIDSAGCTPCRMKLSEWAETIDIFNSVADVDFLMILSSFDRDKLDFTLRRDDFRHAVAVDNNNTFATVNTLPSSESFHTFLLDADMHILAIGNPVTNPKVKDLYLGIIKGDVSSPSVPGDGAPSQTLSRSIGTVASGDTASADFFITNHDNFTYHIQDFVPSCSCTYARTHTDSIPPGKSVGITVYYTGDTVSGHFVRYVDVFIKEKGKPIRLKVYGFNNNINH